MCGIAGLFSESKKQDLSAQMVNQMLRTIQHRGKVISKPAGVDGCTLGHTRLEIVGGGSNKQPLEMDGIYLTFNGEIYNYLDLRTELINRGRRFKTKGDAEVIINAYIVYGHLFVEKLKGIFAFALYDSKEKKLLLCRDRIGVKPLYYCGTTKESVPFLAFASEIKALTSVCNLSEVQVDKEVLCQYLHFQHSLDDRTLFRGINKVSPGEMIIFTSPYEYQKMPYWSLDPACLQSNTAIYYTEAYYKDRLLSLLHDSVRRQAPNNTDFGVYVSGGMDSSAVASLLAEYAQSFHLFSGKYEFAKYDESKYVGILSKHLSFEDKTHIMNISEDDVVDSLRDAIYHMDEPCAGSGLLGQFVLAKKIKEMYPNTKVLIGGQGGDELFGGYARYVVAYLESCIQGAIYPTDRDYVMTLDTLTPMMPILRGYEPMIKSFMSKNMFGNKDQRYFDLVGRSPKEYLSENFQNAVYSFHEERLLADFLGLFSELGAVSYFTKMTYFDFKASLPALLQVDDRVNGAFEFESRVPFLDEDIVTFAFSIPPTYKFAGGLSKGLLRKAMAGALPEQILNRRDKMGFPIPIQEWIDGKGRLKEFLMELFKSDFCKELFAPTDKLIFNRSLWGKISLCLWSDVFGVHL